jgi:hypothetical protein
LFTLVVCVLLTSYSCSAIPIKTTTEDETTQKIHSVQMAAAHMADRAREASWKTADRVHEAAVDARDAAATATDRVREEMSAATEHAGVKAAEVGQQMKDTANHAAEKAENTAEEAVGATVEKAEAAGHSVASTVGHGLAKAGHLLGKAASGAVEAVLRTVPEDEQTHSHELKANGDGLAGMAVKFSHIMTRGKTMDEPADEKKDKPANH